MGCIDYTDAVNGALERLHTTGFYIGDSFANHAPMAAEALAKLRLRPYSIFEHFTPEEAAAYGLIDRSHTMAHADELVPKPR